MTDQPIFKSIAERDSWIIANANYFTVFFRKWRRGNKIELPTLEAAEKAAHRLLKTDPSLRLMIYAVSGIHDCWVKTIQRDRQHGQI